MNHEQIEVLVKVLKDTPRLAEIEIRSGGGSTAGGGKGVSLRLRRPLPAAGESQRGNAAAGGKAATNGVGAAGRSASGTAPAGGNAGISGAPAPPAGEVVRAGLVGIYRPRRKGAPAAEGDTITEGEVLGHIESMRLLNDCVATVSGRLAAVLVQDGQPVEYDQPLFEIRSDDASDDEAAVAISGGAAGEAAQP